MALPKHFVGAGLAYQHLSDYGVRLNLTAPWERFSGVFNAADLIRLFVIQSLGGAVIIIFNFGCLLEVHAAKITILAP